MIIRNQFSLQKSKINIFNLVSIVNFERKWDVIYDSYLGKFKYLYHPSSFKFSNEKSKLGNRSTDSLHFALW